MAHLREHWFPYLLCAIILIVIKRELSADKKDGFLAPAPAASIVPSMYELSNSEEDNLIRYGRELIDSTSWYFGPHGRVAAITAS